MSECSICGYEGKIQEFLESFIDTYEIGIWMNKMNQFQCPSCKAILEIEPKEKKLKRGDNK